MASNDTLVIFMPYANEPPSASYSTFDTRNQHPVLDFDAGGSEFSVFSSVLPRNYAGGGMIVNLHTSYSSATAGSAIFNVAFERIGDELQDVDSDSFATAASMAVDVPPTSGSVNIATMNMADGAAIDSVAVGEKFRLKIQRDAENVSDDATGDAELHAVELQEL